MENKIIVLPNDKAAVDDAFGLRSFIDGLADFIQTCAAPMTVALQGSWGSGKTSMMKMLAQRLKDGAVCMEFNTWQYSQFSLGEQLPVIFYESLIEKLAQTDPKAEKSGETEKLMELCKRAAKTAVRLGANLAGLEDTLTIVSEGMAKPEKTVSIVKTVEDLRSGFQKLVEKRCTAEKDRVVFFVDDLDRLPPERAVELMEVLKVMMECDRCVFVLAIDYDVVIRGVRAKYGQDFAQSKGRSFFDKLIQVPVTLPVSQYQLRDYVRGLLDGIRDGRGRDLFLSEIEMPYAVDFVELTVGHNPRSIKRLLNTYTLNLCVLQGMELPLMTKQLLFGVQCLQMGYESVYHYLCQVCGDSDDLQTFLGWFKGDDNEKLKQTLEADPVLAEKLALEDRSPLELEALRKFIQRLDSFTRITEYLKIMEPERDLDGESFGQSQEGSCLAFDGMCLYQWETLQDAVELSAATALGSQRGRRLSRVPAGERLRVMHQLMVSFNLILGPEENRRLPVSELCYEARRRTVEALAERGLYLRESAVMSLYIRELGWYTDERFFEALLKAWKEPGPFVERMKDYLCWERPELDQAEKDRQWDALVLAIRK